jgi:feruloyl-CoA synthase
VKGYSVFPGYLGDAKKTAEAFDEMGFYKTGDAGVLADPNEPNRGVIFDGRVAEDFKLTTGTWVSVGTLRLRVFTAMTPYAQDIVVTGHDRDEVGVLIFPSPALRAMAGDESKTFTGDELAFDTRVRSALQSALNALCADVGSSQRPVRALILSSGPSLEQGEITDKGYINQRAVLTLRSQEVARLYSDHPAVIRKV